MIKSASLILSVFILLQSECANAWGSEGHKIVDKVAYTKVNKSVLDSIQYYLGDIRFADAGTWMDEVRSNHDFDYMKQWHYINIEKGSIYDPHSSNNIVSALDSSIEHLKHRDRYSREQVGIDIKILMHLIGDLHQPLHVGYGVDRGGNSVEVSFLGHTSNLHKVWDSEIIRHDEITAETCLEFLRYADLPPVKSIDVISWMNESRKELDAVYDFKNGIIDEAYCAKNKSFIEEDLDRAGLRLAFILNSIFLK
jgi:hypothetical protein